MAGTEGTFKSADWRATLDSRGWVIVPDVPEPGEAEAVLAELGELLEQYTGAIRHEVRARPGFGDLQYTQSRNPITPHTEAPGFRTPPRYLALHCHRQARCGGGQTLLADGYEFVESLDGGLAREVRTRAIRFDLVPDVNGGAQEVIAAPILTESTNGTRPILRFSYSVLRDNSIAAPVHDDDLDLDGIDPFNAALCRRSIEFTNERGTGALPEDGSLMIFDNWRMLHARNGYSDRERHLTRYWVG